MTLNSQNAASQCLSPFITFLRDTNTKRTAGSVPDTRIDDIAAALLIQDKVIEALPESVSGWKVARTPQGEVIWGAIFSSATYPNPAVIPKDDTTFIGIEAEIAFRAIADIEPRANPYTPDELTQYFRPVPAIEIVKSRYRNYENTTMLQRVADRISSGGLVVGDAGPMAKPSSLEGIRVTVKRNGRILFDQRGGHSRVDPFLPAVEFIQSRQKIATIRAGQIVTTGAFTGMMPASEDDTYIIEFDGLGAVQASFG